VGAEKAGTTTLATMLGEHPDVFMCDPKEPRFFTDPNWNRGVAWYESLFDGAGGFRAVGEATPAYTTAPESMEPPERIHQTLGDIKYIYMVRHPIERVISHYRHAQIFRWIPEDLPLEQAIERKSIIKDCSRYHYQIEQYLPYTEPEQWHVVVLEELLVDTGAVQREVLRFLEVDESVLAPMRSENVSGEKARTPFLIETFRPIRGLLPRSAINFGRRLADRLGRKIGKPDLPDDVITALREELKPEARRLGEFCGKDLLSIWSLDDPA
jgi:hypothetical protein